MYTRKPHTEETKRKISLALRGMPKPLSTRLAVSKSNHVRVLTLEQRRKRALDLVEEIIRTGKAEELHLFKE